MNHSIMRAVPRLLLLGLALAGCGAGRPITVHPSLDGTLAADVACPPTESTYFVSAVVDKRGFADTRYVGETRKGPLNRPTVLHAEPQPAVLLEQALKSLLLRCHNLTGEQDRAAKQLRTTLLRLDVAEAGGFPNEEIAAYLVYEIEIVSPEWVVEHRAVVTAEASVVASLDTTTYAAEVIRTAIERSLADLSIKLPRY